MQAARLTALTSLLLLSFPLQAERIVFTHESIASGDLDGTAFEDADITFRAVADTDDVVSAPPFMTYLRHLDATIEVEGLGEFKTYFASNTFVEHLGQWGAPSVAFGPLNYVGSGVDAYGTLWGPMDTVFADWDAVTPIGPLTSEAFHSGWADFILETSGGTFQFDTEEVSATFRAEYAPILDTTTQAVALQVIAGETTSETTTFENPGGAPLHWTLDENPGELQPEADGGALVLSHSESMQVSPSGPFVFVCSPDEGSTTAASQYWRTFRLHEFGITEDFEVEQVEFGVEALDTQADITINLYTTEGMLTPANLTLLQSETLTLQPQQESTVTVPISATVPTGATLAMEIAAPDLSGSGRFIVGTNSDGQTGKSWLSASDCNVDIPTPYPSFESAQVHLVMGVSGTTELPECTLPEWLSIAPEQGDIDAGGSQELILSADAAQLPPGEYSATACLASNSPLAPLQTLPVELVVDGVTEPIIFQDRFRAD